MKNIALLLTFSLLSAIVPAQNSTSPEPKKKRKNQNQLTNEVYLAYTYGSLLMTNPYVEHTYDDFPELFDIPRDAVSYGGIMAGYNRDLNRVLSIGFLLNYEHLSYSGYYYPSESSPHKEKAAISDNVITEVTMLTIHYIHKPMIKMYSAVGLGASFAFSDVRNESSSTISASTRDILFAGQVTFIGLRVGRSLGGFFEIGVGSASVISAGISYKFSD
jgi:hypothetical protein